MTINRLRVARPSRFRSVDYVNLLALVVTVLAVLFIVTGTPLALIGMVPLAALGLDGILRGHPTGRIRTVTATALDLITPVLFLLAASLFFRYVASGYWTVLAGLLTGLLFAIIAYADYAALDVERSAVSVSRLILLGADYAALFGLFAVFYAHDLSFPAASALFGVAAMMAAVDVYRDADLSIGDHLLYAVVTGIVLAQVRWALGFVSLTGLLASVFLVLVFYVVTGIASAALVRRLDRRVAFEYTVVSIVGLIVILVGRLVTGAG